MVSLRHYSWWFIHLHRERRGTFIGSLHRTYGKLSYFLSPLYCTCFLHLEPVPPLKSPWNDMYRFISRALLFFLSTIRNASLSAPRSCLHSFVALINGLFNFETSNNIILGSKSWCAAQPDLGSLKFMLESGENAWLWVEHWWFLQDCQIAQYCKRI